MIEEQGLSKINIHSFHIPFKGTHRATFECTNKCSNKCSTQQTGKSIRYTFYLVVVYISTLITFFLFRQHQPSNSPTSQPTDIPTNVPTSQPTIGNGPNIIDNPGFDNGSVAGWSGSLIGSATISAVTTPSPQSGSHSAYVTNRINEWDNIAQDITNKIVPGEQYSVSAFVQVSVPSNTVKLTFREGQSSPYTYVEVTSAFLQDANVWTQITGSYTAPSVGTKVIMYLEGPVGGVDLRVDTVSLVLNTPTDVSTYVEALIEIGISYETFAN